MAQVLGGPDGLTRVVSDSFIAAGVYRSMARYRQARGWWLRDARGRFVDIGGAVGGSRRFDMTLALGRGLYTLGCGPLGSGGVRETVRVGPVWAREGEGPGGHFVLSDAAGSLSVSSGSGCLALARGADLFECRSCGVQLRVLGHSLMACLLPSRHASPGSGCEALGLVNVG